MVIMSVVLKTQCHFRPQVHSFNIVQFVAARAFCKNFCFTKELRKIFTNYNRFKTYFTNMMIHLAENYFFFHNSNKLKRKNAHMFANCNCSSISITLDSFEDAQR